MEKVPTIARIKVKGEYHQKALDDKLCDQNPHPRGAELDDNAELGDLHQGGDWGLEVDSPLICTGPVFNNSIVKYPTHGTIVTLFILPYSYFSHFQTLTSTFQLVWVDTPLPSRNKSRLSRLWLGTWLYKMSYSTQQSKMHLVCYTADNIE